MKLLSPEQYRALAFVQVLNNQEVHPTIADIDAFARIKGAGGFAFFGWENSPGGFLVQTRLIIDADGAYITEAGAAILADADAGGVKTADAVEVAGRMNDPFFYAHVLTQIDSVESSLVIDPYLPSRDLPQLLQLNNVNRVLTLRRASGKNIAGESVDQRHTNLRVSAGARPEVEVRFVEDGSRELHDRLVLARDGSSGLMLGTSSGGTQMTVITRLSPDTARVLISHYEPLWEDGSRVDPIGRQVEGPTTPGAPGE